MDTANQRAASLRWLERSVIACEVLGKQIVRASSAFEDQFGACGEGRAREFASIFSEADARVAAFKAEEARAGALVTFVSKHRRVDGARRWLRWQMSSQDGKVVDALAMEVTLERALDEECAQLRRLLEHAQRLATIGLLASRVVHDLNNLLAPARQGVDLAISELPASHVSRGDLEAVRDCLAAASALVGEIRAHASGTRAEPERIDLAELVRSTRAMFSLALDPNTELNFELLPGTPAVWGQSVQLRQVLLNLVVNASEAIGSRRGCVTVRVEPGETAGGGSAAWLTVSDNGAGMSPETKARLFEPFFSTKGTSRGLGLSGIAAILQAYRAVLSVESELGRGTSVKVCFP